MPEISLAPALLKKEEQVAEVAAPSEASRLAAWEAKKAAELQQTIASHEATLAAERKKLFPQPSAAKLSKRERILQEARDAMAKAVQDLGTEKES
eukprot:92076-Prymnesium_polylepis.1